MDFHISGRLGNAIPTLKDEFTDTLRIARGLDRGIRSQGLYVWGRCSRYTTYTEATAWAERVTERFYDGSLIESVYHPVGKITMSLGIHCDLEDRIRTFAHELRHIGQMHRGKQKHGYLTFEHMKGRSCEADARDFEEKVVNIYESESRS